MTNTTTERLREIERGALKPEEARWVHKQLIDRGEEPRAGICAGLEKRGEHLCHDYAAHDLELARRVGYTGV